MFALGFPPVPDSITNTNVDRRFAKDISQPFSLLVFIKIVANIVDTNNITVYYNHYVTTWNSYKNKQSSTSTTLIVEGYRNFVKDLTLNYNSVAENKFLSQIDYSDPYDLDVALKFIANKIKSIALYYRDKREDVKLESTRKKLKSSTKGFVTSIKERILEFLSNNSNKTISEDLDTIAKNLTVSVDSLYDAEAGYFNKTPDSAIYGAADRDYNEDIFLKSNNQLVTEIFSGLTIEDKELQEVEEIFTNKRELTKKYMGTDFYYLSSTPILSIAPVLNVKSDFNVRYNREFIRILTTTVFPSSSTTVNPNVTISPAVTAKPPITPESNTTPAPINTPSFGFNDSKYDCVNFTCVKRKDGQFKTKAECIENCKKPQVPPPVEVGGGNEGPPPPPKIVKGVECGCDNLKVVTVALKRLTDPNTSGCLDKSQVDIWETQQSITWNCDNPDYQVEVVTVSKENNITPDANVTLKSNTLQRFDKTHYVPCSDSEKEKNLAVSYRGTITYLPTKQVIVCYPESDPIIVSITPCCSASDTELPSDTPSEEPSESPCPPCPSDTTDIDNSDTTPELPQESGIPLGGGYIFDPVTGTYRLIEIITGSTTTLCPDCPSDYNTGSSGISGKYTAPAITDFILTGTSNDDPSSTPQATSSTTSTTTTTTSTTQPPIGPLIFELTVYGAPGITTSSSGPLTSITVNANEAMPPPIVTTTQEPIITTAGPSTSTTMSPLS